MEVMCLDIHLRKPFNWGDLGQVAARMEPNGQVKPFAHLQGHNAPAASALTTCASTHLKTQAGQHAMWVPRARSEAAGSAPL